MKKVFHFILSLLTIYILSRLLIRFLPGDPLETMIAESGTRISRELLAKEMGLDRPFAIALGNDFLGMLHGDFGNSILTREPIGKILPSHLWETFILTIRALALGVPLAFGLALYSFRYSWVDRLCSYFGAFSAALPTAWIGPILIYFLAVKLPLFEMQDAVFLPALTLALGFSGFWARLIRNRIEESLRFGPARGAMARGLSTFRVLSVYGFLPVSGSILAFIGTQIGKLLSGAFITEMLFQIPGMGTLMMDAVLSRDYPVIEACILCVAALALISTRMGEILQIAIDPRKREEWA